MVDHNRWTSPFPIPEPDAFRDMLEGVLTLMYDLNRQGRRPISEIKVSKGAADIICRSPIIQDMRSGPDPEPSFSSSTRIMGIRTVIDDRMPPGVVAFFDCTGECQRLVILVDP